jgi:hypothetical protein
MFREKSSGLKKEYRALVVGVPQRNQGKVEVPLHKVAETKGESVRIDQEETGNSKESQTLYRVLAVSEDKNFSLLSLNPLTGRTHQLRVVCASVLGTPIIGDDKYGLQNYQLWKTKPDHEILEEERKFKNLYQSIKDPNIQQLLAGKSVPLHLHAFKLDVPSFTSKVEEQKEDESEDQKIVKKLLKLLKLEAPLPPHFNSSMKLLNMDIPKSLKAEQIKTKEKRAPRERQTFPRKNGISKTKSKSTKPKVLSQKDKELESLVNPNFMSLIKEEAREIKRKDNKQD